MNEKVDSTIILQCLWIMTVYQSTVNNVRFRTRKWLQSHRIPTAFFFFFCMLCHQVYYVHLEFRIYQWIMFLTKPSHVLLYIHAISAYGSIIDPP